MYSSVLLRASFVSLVVACSSVPASTPPAGASDATATPAGVDFGDYKSETLTTKAWKALEAKDYPAVLVYTKECIKRYGEEGRKMNAAMTAFEPSKTAFEKWALNDVGTSLYIMAQAYGAMEAYIEAADALELLTSDYNYAQCWDPKGWFWRPADNAAAMAKEFRRRAR